MYTIEDLLTDLGRDLDGEEFRALDVPNRFNEEKYPKFGFAKTKGQINGLLMEDEGASGIYVLANKSNKKSATPASSWSSMRQRDSEKKASNNDNITHRRMFFIDVDPSRVIDGIIRPSKGPNGVNTSKEEQALASDVVDRIVAELTALSPDVKHGVIMSGNGYAVVVFLDMIPTSKESDNMINEILVSLANKYNCPGVDIDFQVGNRARMLPVPGTMKRKAADLPERPQRKVEYQLRGGSKRLDLAGLTDLHSKVVGASPLTTEQKEKLERRIAFKGMSGDRRVISNEFDQVKEGVNALEVFKALGIGHPRNNGEFEPHCPYCRKTSPDGGRTGFTIFANRAFCWFANCPRNQEARSVVDIVMEQQNCTALKALEWLKALAKAKNMTLPPVEKGAEQKAMEDGRVKILLTNEEHKHVTTALNALGKKEVYEKGGVLVQVATSRDKKDESDDSVNVPRVRPMGRASVRNELSSVISCQVLKKAKDGMELVSAHIPEWLENQVFESKDLSSIRALDSVVVTPVMRKDGSILQTPGYDDATKCIYAPNAEFGSIPENPTLADAVKAKEEIMAMVEEFPFKSDAHRAAYLALILTPFARPALGMAPSPCFGIDACRNNLGKTKLAKAARLLAEGVDNTTTLPPNEDAMQKKLLAYALQGTNTIIFDNAAKGTKVGGPTLEQWATDGKVEERILGISKLFSGNLLTTTVFTGNNLQFTSDMARRVVHIRLEANYEDPATVKHKFDLDAVWVLANRPRLVTAALTVLRAFVLAGRPSMSSMPSFERWASLVASAVVWVGMPDPVETTRELLVDGDEEASTLSQLLEAWEKAQGTKKDGLRAGEAIDLSETQGYEWLREAIAAFTGGKLGGISSGGLGKKLAANVDHVINGKKLIKVANKKLGIHYKVVSATGTALAVQPDVKDIVDKLIDEQMDAIKAPKANGKAAPGIIRAPQQ